MIPGSFWHVTTKTVMQMSQWHSSQLGAQRQIDKHDKNWQEINMMKHDDKNWQEFWRDQFGSNFVFLDPNDPNDPNSISFDIVRYRSISPAFPPSLSIVLLWHRDQRVAHGFLGFWLLAGTRCLHVVLRHGSLSYGWKQNTSEHQFDQFYFFFTFRLLLDFFTYSVKVWTIQRLDIGFSRHDHACNLSKIPTETRWIFGVAKLSHPALAHQQKKSRSCTQRLSSFFAVAFGRISWSWNFKPSSIGWINVCKIRWAKNKIKLTHGDSRQAQSGMAIATCDCLWLLVIAGDCAMLNCGIAE